MGFVEIYRINSKGDVLSFGIANNHWGCATLIWHDLALRHGFTNKRNILGDKSQKVLKSLCKSIGTGKLEKWEELLLACTFDRVWVPKPLILKASEAFIKFYDRKMDSTIVPTTREMGVLLKQMYDMFHLSTIGAAFRMCSALPSFWIVDTKTSIKAYNIFSKENHTIGQYAGQRHVNIEEYIGNQK